MIVIICQPNMVLGQIIHIKDRIIIKSLYKDNILCNISKNLYLMLKKRSFIIEINELKKSDIKLYNYISRLIGLFF
jgi:hypothetical protein